MYIAKRVTTENKPTVLRETAPLPLFPEIATKLLSRYPGSISYLIFIPSKRTKIHNEAPPGHVSLSATQWGKFFL